MFVVDTNVLLHAVNSSSPENTKSGNALTSFANGSENWALTWGIVYEFLRVSTHSGVFPNPLNLKNAHGFIDKLVNTLRCFIITETEFHHPTLESSIAEVFRLSGNIIHDFHTAVLMKEHGIKDIVTFDTDFRAFPWVQIRDF